MGWRFEDGFAVIVGTEDDSTDEIVSVHKRKKVADERAKAHTWLVGVYSMVMPYRVAVSEGFRYRAPRVTVN